MGIKTCSKCKETKDVSEFGKRKSARDGLKSLCKACVNEGVKRWRLADPEKYKEIARVADKRYYAENKDKVLARHARWYQETKEHRVAYAAKWKKENPEKRRASNAKRRATKVNAMTSTTCLETIKEIYAQCPEGYHVDHKVPLVKGGQHHQNNLCYLPAALNCSKGAKLLEDDKELMDSFNNQVIYPDIKPV